MPPVALTPSYHREDRRAAAFYLGAMAHYVGDVSQYGHSVPNETHHSDYERFVASRTGSFNAGNFESYIALDSLVRRSAYTAVKRISLANGSRQGGDTLGCGDGQPVAHQGSSVPRQHRALAEPRRNELADVLHTFFLNVLSEAD
jgi:hypothetical protein